MSKKKITIYTVIIILAVILIWIGMSSFYTVRENEYALVIRFAKVQNTETSPGPGLHFKIPIIDEVRYFPKEKRFYDIKPSPVLTKDSKNMTVDYFIVWRITDPFVFYTQLLGSISNAESRLDNVTYNAIKNTIGRFEQNAIISSTDERSRDYINETVTSQSRANVAEFGIEVIDVKIKSFELPPDNEQAVIDRMISDRARAAAEFRADGEKEYNLIKNEVDKEVNIKVSDAEAEAERIKAEGESEYMRRLAEAYNTPERREFYNFMRGLEALKVSLEGKEKTVILDKDSQLAKILIGP